MLFIIKLGVSSIIAGVSWVLDRTRLKTMAKAIHLR